MNLKKRTTLNAALAALLLAAGQSLHAASATYVGTATNQTWINPANWTGGSPPAAGDDLIIADATATNALTVSDSAHTIGQLQFGTTGTRTAVFTINGNVTGTAAYILTLGNGIVANGALATAGGNLITKLPIIVQGDQTWSVGGSVPATTSDYGLVLTVGANGTQRPLTLNGKVTKTGTGEVVFIGQNVGGNGDVVVNQGWLKVNGGSSTLVTVGGGGTIIVNSGAVFMLAKNSGSITMSKALQLNDGATFRWGGNNSTRNGLISSPIGFNGTVSIPMDYAGLALDFTGAWSGTINGTCSGTGGTNNLWGDHTGLAGSLNNNATLRLRFGANNAASPSVAYGLGAAAAYYEIYGPATSVQFGALTGTAGTVLNNNTNTAAATLTVGALNTDTTFGGVLADGSAFLSLTKVGTGALTLTGINTLSGGVTVNNGAVYLQGATASAGVGTVTVAGGAKFGGSGTAAGSVNVQHQGTIVANGGTGAPVLTVGPLTLGTSGGDSTTNTVNVYLGGKVVATSGLTVNGSSTIVIVGAAPAVGTYDLIQHSGTINGAGFAGFKMGALPYGVAAHLQNGATAVQLVVDAVTIEPSVWVGNATGTWNLTGTLDWKGATSGTPQSYHEQDSTFFDDSATAFTVNLVTNVTPASMSVTPATHTYTFSGVGSIGGLTALGKDGAGTLIIANSNTFLGGTFITNGTIQIGNGGTTGYLPGTIQDDGNLALNRADALAVPGVISGLGTVEQKGTGIATLGGANTYAGLTTVSVGTLAAGTGTSFGDTNAGVNVVSGATLDVNSQNLGAEPISAAGAGVGGQGAIVNNGPGDQQNATRYVTLTGDATFGGARRWDIRTSGAATDPNGGINAFLHGNGRKLTKVSSNVVAFIQVGDTALGNIDIQGGTLTFSRSSMPGNSSATLSIWPGATLQFHRLNEYMNNPFNKVVGVTNGTLGIEANGLTNEISGPVTLTGSNIVSVPGPTNGMLLSGAVGGSGSLNAVGPGPLILAGNATPAGGVTANGGLVEVDGTLAGGGLTALTTATVGGTGTISGSVTVPSGSTLSPGSPDLITFGIGALSVGSLALQPGSTSRFDVNTDLTTNDRLNASGALTYAGTLVVTNQGYTAYTPGMTFKLFNASSYSGSFASIVPATPALGLLWNTNTLTTDGTLRIIVQPNPRPLLVLSVSSLMSNMLNVVFDTEVDPTSAVDPNNYTISTGQHVSYGIPFSPTNIQLYLDAPLTAPTYSVQVKNVKDLAYNANVVVTTNVPGRFWNFLNSESILITNGYAFAYADKIKIYADGTDIFGTADQFQFVYKEVTGDFDVSVCLESVVITDPAVKAGLMAREINNPTAVLAGDRHFMSAGFSPDPTRNNNFVEYRDTTDGTTVAPAAPRPGATYPTNWIRLKRTGSVLQGFSGPNGLDWEPMSSFDTATAASGAFASTLRLGLAVTSHNAAQTTEAVFHTYGKAKVRPLLTITKSGSDVIVSWPADTVGWTLQSTPSLSAPDLNWVNVPGSAAVNSVTLPIGPGAKFFRMIP